MMTFKVLGRSWSYLFKRNACPTGELDAAKEYIMYLEQHTSFERVQLEKQVLGVASYFNSIDRLIFEAEIVRFV